jgi:hypothetical protein
MYLKMTLNSSLQKITIFLNFGSTARQNNGWKLYQLAMGGWALWYLAILTGKGSN